MKLKDKVVLVTGASSGIGRATALLFASNGAKVIINFKQNTKRAHEVWKKIGKDNSVCIQADVSVEKDVRRLVKESLKSFGHIDILINSAGEIIRPGDWKGDLTTWQKTIEVNLTSAWLMIREVAPLMLAQKSGSIVNISSVYGILGGAPVLAYTSAKGGLITLTRSFAKELAPHIRVNAVAPSNVKTNMSAGVDPKLLDYFKKQTPLGRIADPREIASAIVFLASDEASYITGEIVKVDGGYSLK